MPDELKNPADMSDHELVAEWECIDCDSENTARTEALAAEMKKREVDFWVGAARTVTFNRADPICSRWHRATLALRISASMR